MSASPPETTVQNLDHLGIVAGIIDEIGLVEQVDELLGVSPQRKLSLGQILKAMILNCLGFVSAPLYPFSQFFVGKPIEHLLGEGIKAEDLNDDCLGRALDSFYAYGVTQLFTTLALKAAQKFGVNTDYQHLDSSSISVQGKYASEPANPEEHPNPKEQTDELEGIVPIKITYGHSKDHRPDLKQFLITTICSGDGDVPIHLRLGNGNEVDSVGFAKTIADYRQQFNFNDFLIADAALYNAETLPQLAGLRWISRVPLTLKLAQAVISEATPFAEWPGVPAGYRLIEVCVTYAQIPQRWVIVESEQRRQSDLKQLAKQVEREQKQQQKQLTKLCQTSFACPADALRALEAFKKGLRYSQLEQVQVIEQVKYLKRGRPQQGEIPETQGYCLQASLVENPEAIAAQERIAGRFILATNVLETGEEGDLGAVEVLKQYKQQQSSERGFRFLKDPLFFTASVFLKTPRRIMALAMVMAFSLLVYTLAQRQLRQALSAAQATIPNQLGKPTERPTLRWVFQCFQAIHLVTVSGIKQVVNLSSLHRKILNFLGAACGRYYLLI